MSYYFESLLIVAIQIILCVTILNSGQLQPKLSYEYDVQLVMFFTNLVLHYGCIYIIRNGMQMCKFVVFHSEEFTNPIEAFLLGVIVMCGNVLCEFTNAISTQS